VEEERDKGTLRISANAHVLQHSRMGFAGKFAICNRTNVMIPNSIGTRPWGFGNVSIPYGDEIFNMVQQIW
jgi:hypothetical protein